MKLVHDPGARTATRTTTPDYDGGVPAGRHAFIEDAALTPIFHALARGVGRSSRNDQAPARPAATADPVETFQRDPLTAPIPVQVLVPAPSLPWRPPAPGVHVVPDARSEHGRHHFRTEQPTGRR